MKYLCWFGLPLLCLVYLSVHVHGQSTCEDTQPWCGSYKQLCNAPSLRGLLNTHCKKTCDFCNNTTPACTNAGCEQECNIIDGRARCGCFTGYVLDSDGQSCSDIDECLFKNPCTDPQVPTCHNTAGSFVCTQCPPNNIRHYQSNTCCEKSSLSSCGQNSITGVPAPPGPNSKLGQWPWTVLILVGGRPCTGALISNSWVVAAAHCFSSRNQNTAIVARVGIRSTNQNDSNQFSNQVNIDRVVVHPGYDFPNNNIALAHLQSSVRTSWAVRSICLPNGEVPQESAKCWMSGFEALFYNRGVDNVLVDSGMDIVSTSACSERLERVGRRSNFGHTLCAKFEEKRLPSCAGETGGPIVCQRCNKCDFYIAGIMSYGDQCSSKGVDSFAAFSTIQSYENWISDITSLPVNRDGVCASRRASWMPWGRYSTCTRTCGGGRQSRSRTCANGEPGSPGCEGEAIETKDCHEQLCPVWSRFGSWSDCSVTCGVGVIKRSRVCLYGSIGDDGCNDGTTEQTQECREKVCPFWETWSSWTTCDHTCGPDGVQLAQRRCIGGAVGEGDCVGDEGRKQSCNRNPCPTWSDWSPFSACSETCGRNLMRTSSRVCLHGSDCEGSDTQTELCDVPFCSTSPTYSLWSKCSVTCGAGQQTRQCLSNCDEVVLIQPCVLESCDDHTTAPEGRWGEWVVSHPCDVTCGKGEIIRQRECLGVGQCEGSAIEIVACQLEDCPPHPDCATAEDQHSYCDVVKNLCEVSKVIRQRCAHTCFDC